MDLIALAIPFFLLAMLLELAIDRARGLGLYRSNDAINSLSAGILSTTTGYFSRFVSYAIWAWILGSLAPWPMDLTWFDATPRGIALWIFAGLAWDFCYYWNHRLGHEVSILWAAHAVHHQSEDYNLSTALRQTSTGFLFSWIFYTPLFLAGFPFEVLLTVSAINLIYQFWVHTQAIDRLGWLDRVLVTPSNHRVHHAQNAVYIDRNYGGMLILWDRLFGTFQEEKADEPVIFGVRKPLESWNPFWANLQVYDYLLFDARRTRRWRDKIAVWFGRTGWRPADVENHYPKRSTSLADFQKFDARPSGQRNRYVLFQFAAVVAQVFWVGQVYASEGAAQALLPCALLWMQLFTIGMLNENRPQATRLETARLALLVVLAVVSIEGLPLAGVVTYCLGSWLWLRKS